MTTHNDNRKLAEPVVNALALHVQTCPLCSGTKRCVVGLIIARVAEKRLAKAAEVNNG